VQSCDSLSSQIETLLEVSRLSSGPPSVERKEVDLALLTREIVAPLAEPASEAGCLIEVRADHPVIGDWDLVRVRQIVTNLITNAAAHACCAPIEVSVEEFGDGAVLTVRDGGPGIAPADQARIFDRFVQLAPERLHHRGFGLGLWIVRQNAAALGGKVTVDSAPGAGATFRVELPRL